MSARTLAEHDLNLVIANDKARKTLLRQHPRAPELLLQHQQLEKTSSPLILHLSAQKGSAAVLLIFVKENINPYEQLQTGAKLWKEAIRHQAARIVLSTLGFAKPESQSLLNALLSAVLAGSATLPSYKRKPAALSLKAITVQQGGPAEVYADTLATQAGNHLARWLTSLPPNELDCGSYRRALQQLARREGWRSEFLNLSALRKHQAGAFLAVARANAHHNAGIMRVNYHAKASKNKKRRKLCLIGKGICFDTGGINLKSHKGMYDMHTDMQGSAVAVGTLLALSQLKVPFDVECWLALTENEIGPTAYRPQEVITAANSTTIQVVHSDAEGRMALADTLTLAARHQPDLMIDFATLTGACVAALTERMSGAFSNRPELRTAIETAGRDSGERVWSFPMDSDFDSELDSPIADIMQCTMDNKGDHILAARFLNRFVPDTVPWIHIDLSSASKTGGLAHIPTEITGFGVRWAVEFVTRHAFH
ncbi:MAG: M17 family metallopeptidase [Steroidobacteraceae bacterium]